MHTLLTVFRTILTRVSKIADLKVISRTSTQRYANLPLSVRSRSSLVWRIFLRVACKK